MSLAAEEVGKRWVSFVGQGSERLEVKPAPPKRVETAQRDDDGGGAASGELLNGGPSFDVPRRYSNCCRDPLPSAHAPRQHRRREEPRDLASIRARLECDGDLPNGEI